MELIEVHVFVPAGGDTAEARRLMRRFVDEHMTCDAIVRVFTRTDRAFTRKDEQ